MVNKVMSWGGNVILVAIALSGCLEEEFRPDKSTLEPLQIDPPTPLVTDTQVSPRTLSTPIIDVPSPDISKQTDTASKQATASPDTRQPTEAIATEANTELEEVIAFQEDDLDDDSIELSEEEQIIEEVIDSKDDFRNSRSMIVQSLEKQGYEVTLNNEEGVTHVLVSKEDRNGNTQTYSFGELRENEDGEILFSIGEIRGDEKIFPIDRVDIGEYTVERLTSDGGREKVIKQKARILTSDGRPYYQFMPEDLRLINTEWGKVGEEFQKKIKTLRN